MTKAEAELFEAIAAKSRDTCARLVAEHPELATSYDDEGVSALRRALYVRERDIASDLVDAGAQLDVFDAAAWGAVDVLESQLEAAPELLAERSGDGFAPLHLASFFGQQAAVEALLARSASVSAVADNGSRVQPLHSAVATGHLEIARLLVERGADPNAPQQGGWTPLHGAALHGAEEIVALLLEAGGDPRVVANDGRDAIALAREGGHEELARALEERSDAAGDA